MYNCGISQFVASAKTCLPIKGLILGLSALFMLSGNLTHAAPASELNAFWDDREPESKLRVDHSPWQTFLNKFLDDEHPSGINRLDYWSVNNSEIRELAQYIEYLQSLDPRQLADQEQKAFWINLYNASTVYLVLQQDDDLRTIRKIRSGFLTAGPWQREILTIVRQDLSLDDIEHTILRPIWKDNRIHYVVNCASLGCPNLPKQVFTGENTEQMLETAAREFINHPRAVQEVNGRLQLSEIYKWYIDDFGGNFLSLKLHLNKYASPETAAVIAPYTRADYEYDWSLNKPN
jgi:hypothetical protein